MRIFKVMLALALAAAALAAVIAVFHLQTKLPVSLSEPPGAAASVSISEAPTPTISRDEPSAPPVASPTLDRVVTIEPAENPAPSTNKLERLTQLREMFRALAAGDRIAAIRAAKQITNEVERETALLTLVTEWTNGELSSPAQRARNVAAFGLDAGLGLELAKNPELAVLWADELTAGPRRFEWLQQIAHNLVRTDPDAAFALSQQLPAAEQRKFYEALFANWAGVDTEAALQWAEQYSDPADREAVIQAIRTAAPVGIGAELRSGEDGYVMINGLVPGSPAQLSGQLHPGDRIVAIAQGDNPFLNAQDLKLAHLVAMIRGAPGTVLQLQVLPAGAPPNSAPRTITIVRDQIKFKR